jgi:hypothetical protein
VSEEHLTGLFMSVYLSRFLYEVGSPRDHGARVETVALLLEQIVA